LSCPNTSPCAMLSCTANESLPCVAPFAVRKIAFSFLFLFILLF
jgi:hypothetical protein